MELSQKRIEELKEITKKEAETNLSIENEIKMVKQDNPPEELLESIWERMKKEEKDKELEAERHKKWLVEREAQLQQQKVNRHQLLVTKTTPRPKPSQQPAVSVESETKKVEVANESGEKAPETEPLTVKIENSETSDVHIPPTSRQKITPPSISAPSTSPLLTSLLQSPSPSAASSNPYCSKLSPAAIRDMQQRISPSHSIIYPSTPNSSPTKTPSTPTLGYPDASFLEPHAPSCKDIDNTSTRSADSSPPHMAVSSPTLSKLLESASPSSIKLPISAYEPSEPDDEKTVNEASEESQGSLVNATKTENQSSTISTQQSTSIETRRQSNKDSDANKKPEVVDTSNIKQEITQPKESNIEDAISEVKIKSEDKTDDSQQSSTTEKADDSSAPSTPSRPKRKRPATPITPVPAATRRSGRVRANKDRKNSSEEEPTPSQTPEPSQVTAKKASSATVVAESQPISEESSDNTTISVSNPSGPGTPVAPTKQSSGKTISICDSVPCSPAPLQAPSTPATQEELENQKNYKMWRKSIMLLWRQAATHKFCNLFYNPVTDSEAKGYSTVVYRPMDLTSIRKRIENGQLKTTAEFQRDIMLIFLNAIMYNSVDHDVHQMAVEMQKEILEGIEDFIETQRKSNPVSDTPSASTKPRNRRSTASSSSTDVPQVGC